VAIPVLTGPDVDQLYVDRDPSLPLCQTAAALRRTTSYSSSYQKVYNARSHTAYYVSIILTGFKLAESREERKNRQDLIEVFNTFQEKSIVKTCLHWIIRIIREQEITR